jgi:geranyl-CoA carboxylase alpha subunit
VRRFTSLLIANRGEIVVRVAATTREMGLRTIAVHSAADRGAPHVRACEVSVDIGGAAPAESYLDAAKILAAAKSSGAEAIHPGYGFLSENADFAEAVTKAGLVWVGPPPEAIRAMGDKAAARRQAAAWGAPVLEGYDDEDQSEAALAAAARRIGFPVMIKASAGGGGRGMRRVEKAKDFADAAKSAAAEAKKAFGDARLILERAVDGARHIEIQILADRHGNVVHLGERDCSIQRRHQKIIEEAPSPFVDEALRQKMGASAVMLAQKIGYVGAGTVEFLVDSERAFTFMEMNTRLQVEHPVTEMVTGVDLVEQQLRIAMGEALDITQDDVWLSGHAIEARLCAEAPGENYMPRTGVAAAWRPASFVRVDHALADGAAVSPHYDSMLAKVIAHGRTRAEAADLLARALDATTLLGVETNRAFLAGLARHEAFVAGEDVTTAFLGAHYATDESRAVAPAARAWAVAAWLSAVTTDALTPDPWRGWSSSAPMPIRWKLSHGAAVREGRVHATPHGARVGEGESSVAIVGAPPAPGETGVVHVDGLAATIAWVRTGEAIWLSLDGDFAFANLRLSPPARDVTAEAGAIAARMNGKVVSVLVKPGARVKAGDALVTLEAMKMEHVIAAPADARVKAVLASAGEQVAPGQVLVELESEKP